MHKILLQLILPPNLSTYDFKKIYNIDKQIFIHLLNQLIEYIYSNLFNKKILTIVDIVLYSTFSVSYKNHASASHSRFF